MRRIFILGGLVLALLLTVQTETLADVIIGCVNKQNGNLRIVNDPANCRQNETSLSWNTSGTQGPPGPAGTACWDLNGDGLCGSDEDADSSGDCTAADCQGAPGTPGSSGPAGAACWDLNASGTCDPGSEDKDNNGVCNAYDCQGAPGVGSLGVYDKKDVFLGYLVSFDGAAINVFNPDIPAYLTVNNLVSPYVSPFNLTSLAYTQQDCAGQAATGIGQNLYQLFYEQYSRKYYIVDFTVEPSFEFSSRRISSTGECKNENSFGYHAAVKELTNFPFTPGTLVYPITVRPIE